MQVAEHLGVILAGGQSRRMGGGDKSLLALGSSTLLGHVIARLSAQVHNIALNTNGDPARFAAFGLPVLPDTVPDFPGPLAGILAAMEWAHGKGAATVITVAADTPFFPPDLVKGLAKAGGTAGFALATTGTAPDWHPTFGLWPVQLRDTLRHDLLAGHRKVIRWALANGAQAAMFDEADDPFFNINTPDDLEKAQQKLAQHGL